MSNVVLLETRKTTRFGEHRGVSFICQFKADEEERWYWVFSLTEVTNGLLAANVWGFSHSADQAEHDCKARIDKALNNATKAGLSFK